MLHSLQFVSPIHIVILTDIEMRNNFAKPVSIEITGANNSIPKEKKSYQKGNGNRF